MPLEVSSALIDEMIAYARAAHPREACGLLLGSASELREVRLCQNVHPAPEKHFEIDPQTLIDAHRAARSGGLAVIGSWHSHPAGPPEPSATDRAHATGDGRVWAIIGEGRVGWWRDTPDGFEPLSYEAPGR
ncbi:MAG: Mov34/MPN/PAD-1 family protein [Tsuneonella sp.]